MAESAKTFMRATSEDFCVRSRWDLGRELLANDVTGRKVCRGPGSGEERREKPGSCPWSNSEHFI